jgi:hypothetical protein
MLVKSKHKDANIKEMWAYDMLKYLRNAIYFILRV